MNFQNIINQIAETDPEFYDRVSPRRRVIKNFTQKVAVAAIPFALGGLFKKAYAGGNADAITDTLNFALTLEYLEAEFYANGTQSLMINNGLDAKGSGYKSGIGKIASHEAAHVTFLKNALGSAAVAKPNFDFTARGTFNDVFTNADTFLAVAQAFEDTGVRAYKGQAGNLISNNDVLTAALQIHSMEARHASYIRSVRNAKGWITLNNSDINGAAASAVQPIYDGEQVTTQAGVDITPFAGSAQAASAAFDEPLTKDAVLAIVAPFIR